MDNIYHIWNTLLNLITVDGIVKFVELGLAFWGCSIAARGLFTWREQLVEAPKIELARKIMENFYNIIDTIKYLRRNLRSSYHEKIRQYFNQEDLNDVQCKYLEPLYEIRQNRKLFIEFEKLKNKAKVNFGNDLDDCFVGIIEIINEIEYASRELCSYYDKDRSDDEKEPDLLQEYRHIIYQRENDNINQVLNHTIEKAEKYLRPLYSNKILSPSKLTGRKK